MKQVKSTYLFILVSLLVLPTLGLFYEIKSFENCDNRELNKLPFALYNNTFLEDFEAYFKDHIPYRNFLIHLNSKIKYSLFNSSSKPENTVIGTKGFIHYSSLSDFEIASFSRTNLYSNQQLQSLKETWEGRKLNLSKKNIQYFMAVWPNKSTIYEETLPFSMKIQKVDTIAKIDQVLSYLYKEKSTVKILDVRKLFMKKKSSGDIYLKHDTHWNSLGAFYAYQELMLHMGIKPFKLSDFNLTYNNTTEGDLKKMTGLCNDKSIQEKIPDLSIKKNNGKIIRTDHPTENRFIITNNSINANKNIVIFRDSFTSALMPYIALHFKECHVIWSTYNSDDVDQINPDIVLVAKTERYF